MYFENFIKVDETFASKMLQMKLTTNGHYCQDLITFDTSFIFKNTYGAA